LTSGGGEPLVSYKTTFEYDSLDRATRMIYPDGDQVTYEYNARSLLQRIIGGPNGTIVSNIVYSPSAQQQQVGYGNGVLANQSFDRRQRLNSLLTYHTSRITDPFINFAYDFDGVSNIKQIHDQRSTAAIPLQDKRRNSQAFSYDDLYRLTGVQYNLPNLSTANGGKIDYRYDRIGNMLIQSSDITHLENGLSVTDLGHMSYGASAGAQGRTGRQAADPPGPHALTSTRNSKPETRNFPYDANGNMTIIDGLRCTWDFKDRLVAVENDTMRAEYTYDYTDRRITKRVTQKPPAP
jgi:YD repeat-containing protein